MSKVPYKKPALNYADQLAKLKQRGLVIRDEAAFLDLLEKKSYFRLSGYWYPLLSDKVNHVFKPGASFKDAYDIYLFDRNLRQLVVKELEKIEIAIRAKMIYVFSHQFGPYWYTDSSLFKNNHKHTSTLSKISEEYQRSDAQFINAFRKKYSDSLPPSWTAFEIISFGSISRLFAQIKPGKSKREVGEHFGLDDNTLASWLHGLVYVRNVCAHHSRLWNRVMRIQPSIPLTPKNHWLSNRNVQNNKAYYILSMILYLLNSIDEANSMVKDFRSLLNNYKNVDPTAMGFPKNWETELLWKQAPTPDFPNR
jgi:abortive infection bacteriophage resistance protein